jgi:hypothetical protein
LYKGDFKFNNIRRRNLFLLEENDLDPEGTQIDLTPRQEAKQIEEDKDQIPELKNIPVTSFVPKTTGEGIFKIGLLAPRIWVQQDFEIEEISIKNIPIITQPESYNFFFIEYSNPNVIRGIESGMVQFAVIITLNPASLQAVSEMLRIPARKISPLSRKEYLYNTFQHPYYINDQNQPLVYRYSEVPVFKQKTPGRLDDIPLSFPDFDNTPDFITTSQGPIPAAPYANFATATGATLGVFITSGQSVELVDTSVMSPWQFAPTGWYWEFGSSASPTASNSQNVTVNYGTTGAFTVKLTASNITGSTVVTKENFVIVN